jgi:tetratricopeptide (TPR) repeat protein
MVGAPNTLGAQSDESLFRARIHACDNPEDATPADVVAACTIAIDSTRLDRASAVRAQGIRGMARFALGKRDEALADLTDAILLGSRDLRHFMTRGVLLSAMRQFDRALEDFDQAVWIGRDFPEALIQRGNTLIEVGDPASAVEDFGNAIMAQPDNPVPYEGRSRAYRVLGRNGLAEDDDIRARALRRDAGLAGRR